VENPCLTAALASAKKEITDEEGTVV
jgi:hypothetical protein